MRKLKDILADLQIAHGCDPFSTAGSIVGKVVTELSEHVAAETLHNVHIYLQGRIHDTVCEKLSMTAEQYYKQIAAIHHALALVEERQ